MGCSKFGERWNAGLDDLVIESAYEAYEDAGIDPSEIQACWFGTATAPTIGIGPTHLANPLKLGSIPMTRVENWCTTGHEALRNACFAVACGMYDMVLALGAEKLKDTGFPGLGTGRGMTPVLEARRTAPGSSRPLQIALSAESRGPSLVRLRVLGIKGNGLGIVSHSSLKITLFAEHIGPACVGPWILGIEGDGLGVVSYGPLQIALSAEGVGSTSVGRRAFRIDGDGLGVVGDGPLQITLFAKSVTAV